ncbi:MAG: TIGR02147 family protein [Proteobacteria bacterium]|nr:TIGR02147 family protein [Pseudomonadota bacterium]
MRSGVVLIRYQSCFKTRKRIFAVLDSAGNTSTIIYDHTDYVHFLSVRLKALPQARGSQAALAKFLGVQSSFVSQVLSRRAHLSREQAIKVAEYFSLPYDEVRFFMLLVDAERAGSKSLENFYKSEIETLLREREEVQERIGVHEQIADEAQTVYYSSWVYGAVHILSALPGTQTVDAIAAHLRLPKQHIQTVADWLIANDLVVRSDCGRLAIGKGRIHIGRHSRHVARHHANWRIKSLDSLERSTQSDLHYTAFLGISSEAMAVLKEKLMSFLQEIEPVIAESQEEKGVVLLLDLFELN